MSVIAGVPYFYDETIPAFVARGRAPLPAVRPPWTPAQLGFVQRPTGSDYVAIESLGVGNDLRAAAHHAGANGKILTLPEGVFEFSDFTQGDGGKFMAGIMLHTGLYPNNIRGIVGSGSGTVVRMVANSSHFTATSAQQNTTPPQYLTTLIWFYQIPGPVEFGNLVVQGTEQPHLHHGVRINTPNALVHHARLLGAGYGTFNMPPGETYPLAITGANPVIEDVEIDGRRLGVGTPVSSTAIGILGCTNATIRRSYVHDLISGFGCVQWQGAGLTTEDFWVARPGSGASGYNGAHTNHEMGAGPIRHIRPHIDLDGYWGPTDGRTRRNAAKFGHFVFFQATTPSASNPAAYADTQIIDPVHDSWGGTPGALGITVDIIPAAQMPKVIKNGVQLTGVPRPKWWEDKPAPFTPATQFWISGTGDANPLFGTDTGTASVWG